MCIGKEVLRQLVKDKENVVHLHSGILPRYKNQYWWHCYSSGETENPGLKHPAHSPDAEVCRPKEASMSRAWSVASPGAAAWGCCTWSHQQGHLGQAMGPRQEEEERQVAHSPGESAFCTFSVSESRNSPYKQHVPRGGWAGRLLSTAE